MEKKTRKRPRQAMHNAITSPSPSFKPTASFIPSPQSITPSPPSIIRSPPSIIRSPPSIIRSPPSIVPSPPSKPSSSTLSSSLSTPSRSPALPPRRRNLVTMDLLSSLEKNGNKSTVDVILRVGQDYLPFKMCHMCGMLHSELQKTGPNGPKTLCNTCGTNFQREEMRQAKLTLAPPGNSR